MKHLAWSLLFSALLLAEGGAHLTVTDRFGRDVPASVCAVKPEGCAAIAERPIPVPGTDRLVRISAPGFEVLEARLVAGEQTLKLKAKGSVSASFVSTEKNQEWTAEISLVRDENGRKGRNIESKKVLLPKAPEMKAITFEDVPTGEYWLSWEGAQIAAEAMRVSVKGPAPLAAGKVEIRGGLTVRGFVRDSSGSPIPEATIRFSDPTRLGGQQTGWRSSTSSTGEFKVSGLPISRLSWSSAAIGYVGGKGEWAGEPNLDVVLDKAQLIKGRVIDEKKSPIAGVSILMTFRSEQSNRSSPASPSNDDGGFELYRDFLGELTLRFSAQRFLKKEVKVPSTGKGKEAEIVDLGDVVLSKGRTITGSVVDAKTGEPVDGATIGVAWSGSSTASAGGGRFTLETVPDTDVILEASSSGYAPTRASVSKETAETRILLSRGGTLKIRVCGSAAELSETTAVLQTDGTPPLRREIDANPSGNLEIDNVGAGPYSLFLQWKLRTPRGSYQVFAMGSASSSTSVKIEEGRTVNVSLRCDGVPLGGQITGMPPTSLPIWAVLENENGQELAEFRTDESGRFLTRVPVPGRYAIEIAFPRLVAKENQFCVVPDGGKLDCQFTAEAR